MFISYFSGYIPDWLCRPFKLLGKNRWLYLKGRLSWWEFVLLKDIIIFLGLLKFIIHKKINLKFFLIRFLQKIIFESILFLSVALKNIMVFIIIIILINFGILESWKQYWINFLMYRNLYLFKIWILI